MHILVSILVTDYGFVLGQGIGRAIALRLAKDGLHVAINDLPSSQDKLSALSVEIQATGRECSIHFADVSNEDQVKGMIEEVAEKYGGLDVVSL